MCYKGESHQGSRIKKFFNTPTAVSSGGHGAGLTPGIAIKSDTGLSGTITMFCLYPFYWTLRFTRRDNNKGPRFAAPRHLQFCMPETVLQSAFIRNRRTLPMGCGKVLVGVRFPLFA
jgi:hypothetical protein